MGAQSYIHTCVPTYIPIPVCIRFADGPSEQSVFVMLNGEESELRFVDVTNIKVSAVYARKHALFLSACREISIKVISPLSRYLRRSFSTSVAGGGLRFVARYGGVCS